jgi:hypothetical protein
VLVLVIMGALFGVSSRVSAVAWTEFQAGNIIDDAVFYNKNAMSLVEIEKFISEHTPTCDLWGTKAVGGGMYVNGVLVPASTTRAEYARMRREAGDAAWHAPPYVCLQNYYENPETHKTSFETGGERFEGSKSVAEIIYEMAQKYGINPQVLLVTLKKEYGFIFTDDWPLARQYDYIMGYACPDTGPGNSANCQDAYKGFYRQMSSAAWQFNYYRENITKYQYQPGRTSSIQYSPTVSCGTKSVYIENVATASLYIYTPYTPNEAALRAYPGEASCGAYGNRNFWFYFNEWFGNPHLPPNYWGWQVDSGISRLNVSAVPGTTIDIEIMAKNVGNTIWKSLDVKIKVGGEFGAVETMLAETEVKPEEVGTFRLSIEIPKDAVRSYRGEIEIISGETKMINEGYRTLTVNATVPMGTDSRNITVLEQNGQIEIGRVFLLENKYVALTFDEAGRIIIQDNFVTMWEVGGGGDKLILQGDGNLVLYDKNMKAVWNTKTQGQGGDKLILQGDGNLVLYDKNMKAVWATYTFF